MKNEDQEFLDRVHMLLLPPNNKTEYEKTAKELIDILHALKNLLTHIRPIDGLEIGYFAKSHIENNGIIRELLAKLEEKDARIAELEKALKKRKKK